MCHKKHQQTYFSVIIIYEVSYQYKIIFLLMLYEYWRFASILFPLYYCLLLEFHFCVILSSHLLC